MLDTDLDLSALTPFIEAYVPGFGQISTVSRAGSGQSNPTYVIAGADGHDLVLRRKPFGKLLPSAHAIDREYRVMAALKGSGVPVPEMLAYCEDTSLIGAEFFLMSRAAGQAHMDPRLKLFEPDQRRTVFTNMAKVLGRLHSVDLVSTGLQDYGAPGHYFERGVGRWIKQYRVSETATIPELEELMDWLTANIPADAGEVTLVHGDYRLDNFLINPETWEIEAVLDWELSTTGHPLSDLGAVFMQWSLPPGQEGRGLMGVDRAALGIPSNEEFAATYLEARGGADLRDLKYATTFAFFRMAAILQGVVKRGLDGNASDPEGAAKMASYIPLFAAGGLMAAVG